MKEGRKVKIEELTNNKLRTEFVDNYKKWSLISENVVTGEKIYHYQLKNGAALAVTTIVKHTYGGLKEVVKDYFILNVNVQFDGKKNVFSIKNGLTFYDCIQSKTILVEFIKEYQKGVII